MPAFACYLPDAQTAIARSDGLMVLTLQWDQISAITCSATGACSAIRATPNPARRAAQR
jgi:hypothetical protein